MAINDLKALVEHTILVKEEEWRRAGSTDGWAQHIFDAFDQQPWFTRRRLSGRAGMLALLEEWAGVTEELYARVPFPKVKIHNPHQDWALAMQQMHAFLGLA